MKSGPDSVLATDPGSAGWCLSRTSRLQVAIAIFVLSLAYLVAGNDAAAAPPPTGKLESLHDLHAQNQKLSASLDQLTAQRDALQLSHKRTTDLIVRVKADFADARETLDSIGHTPDLGELMLRHRESLPAINIYTRRADRRKQQIAQAGIQRLTFANESRQFSDADQAMKSLAAQLPAIDDPTRLTRLRELVLQRQQQLSLAVRESRAYRADLQQLDRVEQTLVTTVQEYRGFLNKHFWWLRAAPPTRLADLNRLISDGRQLLTPAVLSSLGQGIVQQVLRAPLFWLAFLISAALLVKRRALIRAIRETATTVGRPMTDGFFYTVKAIGLTMLVALPLSLVMIVAGRQLQLAPTEADAARALGYAMVRVAILMYVLRVLRQMGIERGFAIAHLRWPAEPVKVIHNALGWLIMIQMPAALIGWFALALYPEQSGGLAARLGFLVFHVALAGFAFRLLNPRDGVFVRPLRNVESGLLARTYLVIYAIVVLLPLGLVVELFTGYAHSAIGVSNMFIATLWLTGALVLLYSLAKRWLLLTRRRLAYEAALQRHRALLAARAAEKSEAPEESTGELELDEPEINLEALSDSSLGLVAITSVIIGLFGLYLIWTPLLPALRVFDDWQLWSQSITVDGQAHQLTTTLGDLGLALIYVFGTAVLVNRMPSVLEIVLLQRAQLSDADRYTVTKLTTYSIVAIGTLMVLHALGAQWSQLQWLVAALGVGIGFGLQEIVANFVSGLIILFERPIRVGDVVTVGDTSGVVTKIRIRATTIRDWDRKELLVPNKDLITGRVLNWSLSDATTRLVIELGVAYGTDVEKALSLMREAADEHELVLKKPAPLLSFDGFGDSALLLTLRAYVSQIDHRIPTVTQLRTAISQKFKQAGITIAYPQRDMHFDTREPLRVSVDKVRPG